MSKEDENIQIEEQKEVEDAGTIKFTRRFFYTALLPVTFVTGLGRRVSVLGPRHCPASQCSSSCGNR